MRKRGFPPLPSFTLITFHLYYYTIIFFSYTLNMEDNPDSEFDYTDSECDSECEYGADIHDPKDDSDLDSEFKAPLEAPLKAPSEAQSHTSAKPGPSTSASTTTANALKRSGLPPTAPKTRQN
jgi:hypothetical protein